MRRWAVLFALSAVTAQPASAASPPPKLAVVIEVEGLTTEIFQRYRGKLSGGFDRLGRGAVFINAAASQDQVGLLAVQVREPGVTGVVTGSTSTPPGFRNRWTWNGSRFADNAKVSPWKVLPVANQAIAALVASAEPDLVPPPACAGAEKSARFARAAGDWSAFSSSPALDGAVLAVGAGMIGELRMGVDATPDVMLLRLPALARTIATFGRSSEAACLHLLSMDRDLADFFTRLDRGGIDYIVGLTGGPGGQGPLPMLFWRSGVAGVLREEPVSTADLAPTLAAAIGAPIQPSRSDMSCLDGTAGITCSR